MQPMGGYARSFQAFIGDRVTEVSHGMYELFIKSDHGAISIECRWEWRSPTGVLLDRDFPLEERTDFRVWRLLGARIVGWCFGDLDGPSVVLSLSDGTHLHVQLEDEGLDCVTTWRREWRQAE